MQLDTERHYLPTVVVPIYLLAFLHASELLGWQELGQATGAHSIAWIRSYDCWSSDLAAQRLLRFNPQHHHVPNASFGGGGIISLGCEMGVKKRMQPSKALEEAQNSTFQRSLPALSHIVPKQ